MAGNDINYIIPKLAIDGIKETDKAITDLDNNIMKIISTVSTFNDVLKKEGVSFQNLNAQQKQATADTNAVTEAKKQLEAIDKKVKATTDEVIKARVEASQAMKDQKDKITALVNAERQESGSIDALRNRNKQLTKERNSLSTATRKGRDRIAEINKELNKNNETIKKNSDALSQQKQNIGNYSASIQQAAGQMGFMGGSTQKVTAALNFLSVSLKTLRGALISTGIGALVVALGSLVSYFQSTEEGAAKLQKILTPLKILFGNLKDAAADLGERLVWVFDNPKQAVSDLWDSIKNALLVPLKYAIGFFNAFGDVLTGVWELDSEKIKKGAGDAVKVWETLVTDFKDYAKENTNAVVNFFKDIADETARESEQQNKLIDQQLALDKKRRAFLVEEANIMTEISQLKVKANDDSVTAEERQKAINKAIELNSDLANRRIALEQEQLRIMEIEASFSDSNAETLNAIAEKKREIVLLSKEEADSSLRLINTRDTINKELQAELDLKEKIKEAELAAKFSNKEEDAILDITDDPQVKLALERAAKIKELAQSQVDDSLAIEAIGLSELERLYSDGVLTFEEYEALKTEIVQTQQEKRLAIAQSAIDSLAAIGDTFFQIQNQQRQEESAAIARQKEYELRLAGDNQEKINAINQKYAKKEAELKTKQAKDSKKQALFNAIINLASGIVAMFQAGPAGLVLAALTTALGAVQIATIASQPIPQFFTGTESAPGGLISVGEKGRELIQSKSGDLFLANKPTITSGLEGAKIWNNRETERIMSGGYNIGFDTSELKTTVERGNANVVKAIKEIPSLKYNAIKRELSERSNGYVKTIKNVYFG